MRSRTLAWWGLGLAVCLLSPTALAATVTVDANKVVRVDGQAFFPIMQWLQCRSRIAAQAPLGINTFVGNGCGGDTSQEYLDECKANGVWGVMDPEDMSVQSHDALLGWVFGDEPDLQSNQVEPADIISQYQAIKSADPNHVTFLTLTASFYSEMNLPDWMGGSRDRYTQYPNGTDLVGFDLYPVYGWCQPTWMYRVGASQTELASTYAPTKATYQWIEASDESGQWCENCDRCTNPPANCDSSHTCSPDGTTPQEVRNEVWQAIAHGATAIGYFTHAWECPDYTQFCVGTTLQAELQRTNGQISALTTPLLDGATDSAQAAPSPQGRFDVLARVSGNRVLVVGVNVERTAVTATLTVPSMVPDATVEVYEESRTIQSQGSSFTDSFDPLAVHIYWVDATGGGQGGSGQGGSGQGGSAQGGSAGAGMGGAAGHAGSATGGGAPHGGSAGAGVDASAGGAVDGGTPASPSEDSDDGGCGCRTQEGSSRGPFGWLSLAALGCVALLRRRTIPRQL